jgi:hypothetical protein
MKIRRKVGKEEDSIREHKNSERKKSEKQED